MSEDFEAALRAMAVRAAHAEGDGRGLVTAALVARTRRRRRLHDTAVAGLATATVVGVVLAGAAVAGPGPQSVGPATSPTTTVAPSPAPPGPTAPSASAPATPTPPPTPSPTPAPTTQAPPAPTTAPAPPALDALVLTAAGLDRLTVGGAVPAAPSTDDLVRLDPDACAGTDLPERWVAAYPEARGGDGAPTAPFTVWVDGGQVRRVEVRAAGPRTTGGIGVGSTLAELRAAHPEMTLLVSDGGDVDVWGVTDGGNSLTVEVASSSAQPGVWDPAQVDRVMAMVAMPGEADEFYYPAWGGDTCG